MVVTATNYIYCAIWEGEWEIGKEVIQRGGIPSALDRLTAIVFGKAAVDLI
ncbi:hypothetical protein IQ244_08790 [Nostoc sp. LEGE 06077]|nr:hypothetical protein [Nostoc sp. LEGE 06077]